MNQISTEIDTARTCRCHGDRDVEKLRDLIAAGLDQIEASQLLWSGEEQPTQALAERHPSRWARALVRTSFAAAFPWLRLPPPIDLEVS